MKTCSCLLLMMVLSWATPPLSSADGRTEINQTSVDAAGGFPVMISAPGSFVLTGDLTVPADTDGFLLTTNEVVLDLNGFAIAGPATCSPGSCVAGIGVAIRGLSGIAHASRVTLRNGTIRGFAGNCVQLGSQSHVEGLVLTRCGRNGIAVSNGSIVMRNRVYQTGEHGISMSGFSHPPTYGQNTIAAVGLGGSGFYGVSGGRAFAGNSCEDRSCSPNGQRRFYLTEFLVTGSVAASQCAPGFRVAGLGEIFDTTALYYEPNLGLSPPGGPPHNAPGWLYTGNDHCSDYTSSSGSGVSAELENHVNNTPNVPPWSVTTRPCTALSFVWCIED